LVSTSACEGKTGAQGAAPAADASDKGKNEQAAKKKKHQAAPEIDLAVLGGGDWRLSDNRGQVLLLNVWATWCKPCRKELPELARLHKEYGPRGFSVVGVSVDPARKEPEVKQMVEEMKLPFPVLLDPDNVSVHDYGITGYPTTFVIDREGGVRMRRDGIIYEHDESLAASINEAIDEGAKG
jgi:thiol-disulfide isomerase/thioredoxin